MSRQWSPARIDMLRKLAGERKSASQIAEAMSEKFGTTITRSAVIGQANRNGITLDGRHPKNTRDRVITPTRPSILPRSRAPESHLSKEKRLSPRAERNGGVAPSKLVPVPPPRQEQPIIIPESQRVMIIELRESMCKFPVVRVDDEWLFCGAVKPVDGKPYCQHHASIAYASAPKRLTSEETKLK